jgi:hypothetical protein
LFTPDNTPPAYIFSPSLPFPLLSSFILIALSHSTAAVNFYTTNHRQPTSHPNLLFSHPTMDSNFTKDLSEALPARAPPPSAPFSGVSLPFPGNWPAFVRPSSWNLVVERLEHCPMEWATDVVYLLSLDGADMRDDYPGFGRRL